MEKSLLVWIAIFGFTLIMAAITAAHSDEALSRKWSKVRVRVDENRNRHPSDPHDEEFDMIATLPLLIVGAVVLLILMLLGGK